MLEVHILIPDQKTKIYDVTDDSFIIGRGKSSRVRIDSEHISRSHLKVVCIGEDIHLQDFTSANWVSYNGEKLNKDQAVKYISGSTCLLPGDIQVKFIHKDGTRIDQVKHELTMINFNVKKLLSKTVQDEMADIEKKEADNDEFFGRSELEIRKMRAGGTRTRSANRAKSKKVIEKIPFKEKYPNIIIFSQLAVCSILVFGFFYYQNEKKKRLIEEQRTAKMVSEKEPEKRTKYVKTKAVEQVRIFSNSREEFLTNLKVELKCRGRLLNPFCKHFIFQKSRFEGGFVINKKLIMMIDIPHQRRFVKYKKGMKEIMKLSLSRFSVFLAYSKIMHPEGKAALRKLIDNGHELDEINFSFYEFDPKRKDYFQIYDAVFKVKKLLDIYEEEFETNTHYAKKSGDLSIIETRLNDLQ